MNSNKTMGVGRQFSPLKPLNGELFFSLVDYCNNYFISDKPNKILEFYDCFKNRDQLIKWMRERPMGVANIREVDGNKDIIVVIPTADYNGKFARDCRENIFKGLHIIFVESGEVPDPYFNYAHNCNAGIKKAMEHNPKWIVVSNDDMYKIDEVNILKNELSKIKNADIVYTKPSRYHSTPMKIVKPNFLFHLYYRMNRYGKKYIAICKRFNIQYFPVGAELFKSMFRKKEFSYIELQSFIILSSIFIERENSKIFDEVFLNQTEDTDLALRITINYVKSLYVDYKIGSFKGSTFGMKSDRKLRSFASLTYFTAKWESKLSKIL
jgi:hypothetical protein